MITNFISDGNIYPAVGISFGLSSLYELLKDKILDNNIDFYIIPLNTELYSLSVATKLRNMGYKVEIETNNRKLKKCIEYADKENIPYVIVLGSDEENTNIFKIKDMNKKIEYEVDFNNIDSVNEYINIV